jgi:uncharacterized membrane protein
VKLSYLWRGFPGHPVHPRLSDATIGIYTFAAVAALADVLGISDEAAAHGWWLALLLGLIVSVPAAVTGVLEWREVKRGTPLWWPVTYHGLVMVTATVLFLIALIVGKDSFDSANITSTPLLFTLIAYGILAAGGFLGGSLVFKHGMRVLPREEAPGGAPAPPPPP